MFVHLSFLFFSKLFTFSSSSQEPLGQLQPNFAQSILGWRVLKGPHPFPRVDKGQKIKIISKTLKMFFFRTTGSISTKFGTRHAWIVMIQVCSNEWPHPSSQSGYNTEIIKCDLRTPELVDFAHQFYAS